MAFGEISNLISRFFLHLDSEDFEQFSGLFVPTGTCTVSLMSKTFTGHQELQEFARGIRQRFPNSSHWEANVAIDVDEAAGRAQNTSYWKAVDGAETVSYGKHDDVFVRVCPAMTVMCANFAKASVCD
eukprot:TRINITY_DN1453_c0_g1_i1.p1 TRINITY_DN1453_c0_g1~~TRINITY_DN1453_c0_g1_i1.p1  ORF type:complete len:128 (-),score=24.29 TRINITY_DN1453_c0_g1_i1:158-541(-)